MSKSDNLVFLPHMGLGDVILVNGMLRYLAKSYKTVGMPCKENNLLTVRRMFEDMDNLFLLPVVGGLKYTSAQEDVKQAQMLAKTYKLYGYDYVGLGFFGNRFREFEQAIHNKTMTYEEFFYLEAGVPFEEKWNSFKLNRNPWRELDLFDRFGVSPGQYVFLHDDPDRGRVIDRSILPPGLPVITPKEMFYRGDILDYGYVMESAKELHMTNSSFADLADFFNLPADQKKCIHLYALTEGHFHCPVKYKHNFQMIYNSPSNP